jgi:hypothetical protein
MLTVIDGSKLIENPGGRLAFERSDHVAQNDRGRVAQKKMEVVGFAIDFSDFAVNVRRPIPSRFRTESLCGSAVSVCLRNLVQKTT